MIRVGLTGGIASGKSLISKYFEDEGITVLDADKIYKNLLKTNKLLYNEVKRAFNLETIDLQVLGHIVFNENDKLSLLNKIAHPYVIQVFKEQLTRLSKTENIVVLDIPLLFEAKMEEFCDVIICVYVEENIQVERLMMRNKINANDALIRIKSQMPLSEKTKISNYVIDNSFSIEDTHQQFLKIFSIIKEKAHVI